MDVMVNIGPEGAIPEIPCIRSIAMNGMQPRTREFSFEILIGSIHITDLRPLETSHANVYLPKKHFSKALSGRYRMKAATEPSSTPRSPVRFDEMDPVYHACDIDGMMTPKAHRNDAWTAMPGGSFFGAFHTSTLYGENV